MSRNALQAERSELRAVVDLRPHPQAAEVPILGESEYEALRDDIDTRGPLVPIEVCG